MCGIFCLVSRSHPEEEIDNQSGITTPAVANTSKLLETTILPLLKNRGPDAEHVVFSTSTSSSIKIASYILWTQGNSVQKQPIVSESKIFSFNGDIYAFDNSPLPSDTNDGLFLFNAIEECTSDDDFLLLISKLQGPFAWILLERLKNRLWFARDYFGRSSLLFGVDGSSFFITSVAPYSEEGNIVEIPSSGVFCLDLNSNCLNLYPWKCLNNRIHVKQCTEDLLSFLKSRLDVVTETKESIIPSVSCRLKRVTLDSSNLTDLQTLVSSKLSDSLLILKVREILKEPVAKFLKKLRLAVRQRVELKPPFCKNCLVKQSLTSARTCCHSKISVLFSGGLDSTVLAYLVCELLAPEESVDLINVAFSVDENPNFNVPDRQTGLDSFKALKDIFEPRGVAVNFVEANVTKTEVQRVRQEIVLDLVSPLRSVLDDSIGCCLWFASRGKGILKGRESETLQEEYTSPSRIIFVGSGADELLGGYSRHRSAFENKSWEGLVNEMQEDIDRISMRNLGRDNRIITNHGVCPRMPFLDENVVKFLTQDCDIWSKCCPLFPRGLGEKILLRAAAVELFGAEYVNLALFPKRAMQFGSRIAKLENSKEKGGDVCQRLGAASKNK